MNEVSKVFWAAALIVLGFFAACWFGPASRDASLNTAMPAGWSTSRLQLVPESSSFVAGQPGVIPTSGVETALDYSHAAPPLVTPPPVPSAGLSLGVAGAAADSTGSVVAADAANTDRWWSVPASTAPATAQLVPGTGPSEWQTPAQPLRALADASNATAPSAATNSPPLTAPSLSSSLVPSAAPLVARAVPPPVPATVAQPTTPPQDLTFQTPHIDAWDATADAAVAPGARTHIVSDGDSLQRIAERYYGDANRAGEIFAANRDVLQNAMLLPINAELRIPAMTSAGNVSSSNVSSSSAVPPTFASDNSQWGTATPTARLQPPQPVTTGYAP